MQDQILPITANLPFQFSCHPNVACFNECCRDLQQFLTPYDIVRLRKHLDMASGKFLKKYTASHTGGNTGLPVITIRALSRGGICPFVSDDGCTVYQNRPSSCRIYPLARAIARNRHTGEMEEHFALLREVHCRGCEGTTEWTPRNWMADQGLQIYNQMNDLMLEIIRLKNRFKPGPLSPAEADLFHIALYDIDVFRAEIQKGKQAGNSNHDDGRTEAAMSDDIVLLQLGYRHVKRELFGI